MVRSAPAQNTRGSALASTTGMPGSAASASVSERSRLTSSALRRSGRDRRTQRKPAGLVSTTRWDAPCSGSEPRLTPEMRGLPKRLKNGTHAESARQHDEILAALAEGDSDAAST